MNEMNDFRHLMYKGLELKTIDADGHMSKCVIYTDSTGCETIYCGKQKNARNAVSYRMQDITVSKDENDEGVFTLSDNNTTLHLVVISTKVRGEHVEQDRC